jgi:signal transduction histidine kinase
MLPSGTGADGSVAPTIALSQPVHAAPERISPMADRSVQAQPAGVSPSGAAAADGAASEAATAARDYYDKDWGDFVTAQGVDEGQESWYRLLPVMRVYGFVTLAAALAVGYPRDDPGGWRGPLSVAAVALLAIVFWFMWVRRPLWQQDVRLIEVHGVFQVVAYAVLVIASPGFAILQLLVYPQVVFSLPLRWSVAGGLAVGAITAIALLFHANGDVPAALPGVLSSVLGAAMVVAIGVWIRETIAQSLGRRALLAQLTAARQEAEAAERKAGAAEERARLAREIHDTLAQGFASVVANLEAADASLPGDVARVRTDIRAAAEIARASLADARTLVWALRPEAIATAGLPAAIERVAAGVTGHGGPAIEVEVSGRRRQLHPDVEITLLRAAQEALANARRHAAASHVTVTLTYFAEEVSLDVADDGCGFQPAAAAGSGGLGLLGMRERAVRLGGRLDIESAPGEGTAIAVTLPAIEASGAIGAANEATAGEPPAPRDAPSDDHPAPAIPEGSAR